MASFVQKNSKIRMNQNLLLLQVADCFDARTAFLIRVEWGHIKLSHTQVIKFAEYFIPPPKDELFSLWLSDTVVNDFANEPMDKQGFESVLKNLK